MEEADNNKEHGEQVNKALKERKVSEEVDNKEAALEFKVELGVLDSKGLANKVHGEVNKVLGNKEHKEHGVNKELKEAKELVSKAHGEVNKVIKELEDKAQANKDSVEVDNKEVAVEFKVELGVLEVLGHKELASKVHGEQVSKAQVNREPKVLDNKELGVQDSKEPDNKELKVLVEVDNREVALEFREELGAQEALELKELANKAHGEQVNKVRGEANKELGSRVHGALGNRVKEVLASGLILGEQASVLILVDKEALD